MTLFKKKILVDEAELKRLRDVEESTLTEWDFEDMSKQLEKFVSGAMPTILGELHILDGRDLDAPPHFLEVFHNRLQLVFTEIARLQQAAVTRREKLTNAQAQIAHLEQSIKRQQTESTQAIAEVETLVQKLQTSLGMFCRSSEEWREKCETARERIAVLEDQLQKKPAVNPLNEQLEAKLSETEQVVAAQRTKIEQLKLEKEDLQLAFRSLASQAEKATEELALVQQQVCAQDAEKIEEDAWHSSLFHDDGTERQRYYGLVQPYGQK